MYVTIRETEARMSEGGSCRVPAGTEVIPVTGGQGVSYAVKSSALIVTLTGNTHDPHYRYAWVNTADVEETSWKDYCKQVFLSRMATRAARRGAGT